MANSSTRFPGLLGLNGDYAHKAQKMPSNIIHVMLLVSSLGKLASSQKMLRDFPN